MHGKQLGSLDYWEAASETCSLFKLCGWEAVLCWWCITCIHVGCFFSWLPEGVKGGNRRGDKMHVSGILSGLASFTWCVALLTLICGSDSQRQLTSSLPLTSSLRTRDHGDLLPSESQGGVSCWEDLGSAGRPGRQTSSILKVLENASCSPNNLAVCFWI